MKWKTQDKFQLGNGCFTATKKARLHPDNLLIMELLACTKFYSISPIIYFWHSFLASLPACLHEVVVKFDWMEVITIILCAVIMTFSIKKLLVLN